MSGTEEKRPEGAEEAEEKDVEYINRDDERSDEDRGEREDLNTGMVTGTHDSIHRGVRWGPLYRVRRKSGKAKENPEDQTPKDPAKTSA